MCVYTLSEELSSVVLGLKSLKKTGYLQLYLDSIVQVLKLQSKSYASEFFSLQNEVLWPIQM